jgi:23S rRNA pseudouridine2605 synthase
MLELPATGWLRRYRVRAHGRVERDELDRLRQGITIDGVRYGAIEATLDRAQGSNVWLTFAIREGKNREVKNVLGHLGLAVNRLIRVSFGPFQLGELPEGAIEEVRTRTLRDQLGERLASSAGADFAGPIVQHDLPQAPVPPRHPEAPASSRASKGDGPHVRGRSSFEARPRGRAPQDDGVRVGARGAKRKSHRRGDPDRIGAPERARRDKRRGRRPPRGKGR